MVCPARFLILLNTKQVLANLNGYQVIKRFIFLINQPKPNWLNNFKYTKCAAANGIKWDVDAGKQ
jgi:hypothetical protein